jgi:hypothetical protein
LTAVTMLLPSSRWLLFNFSIQNIKAAITMIAMGPITAPAIHALLEDVDETGVEVADELDEVEDTAAEDL